MYKSMKNLITRKYYKTADEAHHKLDVFYACYRLSDDEFVELTALVEEIYGE